MSSTAVVIGALRANKTLHKASNWIRTQDFTSFSIILQSHQDNDWVIMKSYVHRKHIYDLDEFSLCCGAQTKDCWTSGRALYKRGVIDDNLSYFSLKP